jgi:hypothetical protein
LKGTAGVMFRNRVSEQKDWILTTLLVNMQKKGGFENIIELERLNSNATFVYLCYKYDVHFVDPNKALLEDFQKFEIRYAYFNPNFLSKVKVELKDGLKELYNEYGIQKINQSAERVIESVIKKEQAQIRKSKPLIS